MRTEGGLNPQPIQTEYAGVRFRSRLEARWAVFFDALNVRWEYEREGYELPSGRYLPDFFLPDWGWVEIKGQAPTGHEESLLLELMDATDTRGVIFPWSPLHLANPSDGIAQSSVVNDYDHWPCVCPMCRRFGIEFWGRGERVCGKRCVPDQGKYYTWDAPEILAAIDTVRGHRFWDPPIQKTAFGG